MALQKFVRDVKKLSEAEIPKISVITSDNNPGAITVLIEGIRFDITADNYPISSPLIIYINAMGERKRIGKFSDWSPVGGLIGVVYTLMLDYLPEIIEENLNESSANSDISILNTMTSSY